MSKIGIFLGSFNPPHIGHYEVVRSALDCGIVDKVVVIPAWQNIWKEKSVNFWTRYNMCVDTFKHFIEKDKVEVSAIESSLSSDYATGVPTYVTLLALRSVYDKDLTIITTQETYSEIKNWKFGDTILKVYNISIAGKDFPIINYDISSTKIRNLIKENKSVEEYVCSEVENKIKDLYK